MRKFPEPIERLANAFGRLPGVGPKTALRYVFHLLKQPKAEIESFARAIENLTGNVSVCEICRTYTEESGICAICSDGKRSKSILCVVAEPREIATFEATGSYSGRYYVLGGVLNPIEGSTPDTLNIAGLIKLTREEKELKEIILAFSPDMAGEATILYIKKQLSPLGKKITRLARGLPVGADLEFADEITLSEAVEARREV